MEAKNGSSPPAQTAYRHPLAAVGGALVIAGGFMFFIMLLLDLTASGENPYRAIMTFILAPVVLILGLLLIGLAAILQARKAHKRGEKVRFSLLVDFSDPLSVRNLWIFLGLTAVLLVIAGYSGTRAFETTESVAFCGETCHEVMKPQYVTYHNSPHARVQCVECHIGPGATFWVKSKIDGMRQVVATMFDTFPRPIPTPVHDLRPAQDTCEGCHWPSQFYGSKLISRTYYRTDEQNSPWTVNLLMKIGGANPRVPGASGIHWHMLSDTRVEYLAIDAGRQKILQIQATGADGKVTTYTNATLAKSAPETGQEELRVFDCMDCHNRPSHTFLPPAVALNRALRARQISPGLPYVRKVGLELLNTEYGSDDEAVAAIQTGLKDYYREHYAALAASDAAEIDTATAALQEIYLANFFPEMKTDYRARANNLSHFVNDGCFRCHNPDMASDDGKHLAYKCDTCHLIVAQGPSENVAELESNLAGLEFKHPEDIMGMWKDAPCTTCHSPDSGY